MNMIDTFKKVCALEEVERVPAIPTLSGLAARLSGVPLKILMYDAEATAKAHLDAQREIGHDALFAYMDALYVPEAFGCRINFLSSGPVDAEPMALSAAADVEALPDPDVHKDGRLPLILSVVEKLVKAPGREVPVLPLTEGPFTTCARIIGTEKMMRAVFRNRALIESLQEKVGRALARFGEAVAALGAEGIIIADPVGSSTMVSPRVYEELILPHLQRYIRGLPIPAILHVCGDTEPILPMMAQTGARVLSLDQCMDLLAAKEQVAGRCGIGGNVHPVDTLLMGTVEDVKRETMRCLNQGGKKGYILMAGCAVPPRTPLENIKAMIETAHGAA
jgi:MtaA/CmuA family methyltransferase